MSALDSSVATFATLIAAASSLALGAGAVARRPRTIVHWSFALGMAGFAAESVGAWILLAQTSAPEARRSALQAFEILRLLLLVPWTIFAVQLLRRGEGRSRPSVHYRLIGWIAVLIATMAMVVSAPAYLVYDVEASFYAARLTVSGRVAAAVQLASLIVLLVALEATLRSSRGFARWRTKFLVLGLGGAALARVYFLSQTLLFSALMASYVLTIAATQILANVVIVVSLLRDRLTADVRVSHQVVYRSVAAGVLGLYLIAVGGVGWVLNYFGLSEAVVWSSLAIFVTAIALSAVMLSESVRWKIKRFLSTHIYHTKYDYRQQWMSFTKRLGSLVTVDELAPQLLQTCVDAVGATTGVLYLKHGTADHRAACFVGFEPPTERVTADSAVVKTLTSSEAPVVLGEGATDTWPTLHPDLREGAVAVPLRHGSDLIGFMVIGAERTGLRFSGEDLEFLSTVAEQGAIAISTLRLSESLAQAREFEAFHRLTSFIIHDLKNSISGLSMLSANALKHFDDPEFQRDAVRTLARTVERMTNLIGRLSAGPELPKPKKTAVDVAALVLEASLPLLKNPRIAMVKELESVAPIPGDPDALLRVVQNLVTNAIESIQDQGTVTLKTFERAGQACIVVADTGSGMSEEFVRTSLFAPFRSTKHKGWGIGLYQSKGIVEAHGGTIDVVSTPGQGTTFEIRLPAVRVQ